MIKLDLDEITAYKVFHSVKRHYETQNTTIEKYGYLWPKMDIDKMSIRNDRHAFKKISQKYQTIERFKFSCGYNMFFNPSISIFSFDNDEIYKKYGEGLSYNLSMKHYFEEDIKKILKNNQKIILSFRDGSMLNMVMKGDLKPQTFILLNRITGNKLQCDTNPVTEIVLDRLKKFISFVTVPDVEFYNELIKIVKTNLTRI